MVRISFAPQHFTSGEIAPDSHWVGGLVNPRAGLELVEKIEILALIEDLKSQPIVTNCISLPDR
jgi:hypothetical protein